MIQIETLVSYLDVPMTRIHAHHLIFITALLLVWSVGHMDPQVKDWVIKHGQVPRVFELVTHLTI